MLKVFPCHAAVTCSRGQSNRKCAVNESHKVDFEENLLTLAEFKETAFPFSVLFSVCFQRLFAVTSSFVSEKTNTISKSLNH